MGNHLKLVINVEHIFSDRIVASVKVETQKKRLISPNVCPSDIDHCIILIKSETASKTIQRNTLKFTITGLKPETEYRLMVTITMVNGKVYKTGFINVRTCSSLVSHNLKYIYNRSELEDVNDEMKHRIINTSSIIGFNKRIHVTFFGCKQSGKSCLIRTLLSIFNNDHEDASHFSPQSLPDSTSAEYSPIQLVSTTKSTSPLPSCHGGFTINGTNIRLFEATDVQFLNEKQSINFDQELLDILMKGNFARERRISLRRISKRFAVGNSTSIFTSNTSSSKKTTSLRRTTNSSRFLNPLLSSKSSTENNEFDKTNGTTSINFQKKEITGSSSSSSSFESSMSCQIVNIACILIPYKQIQGKKGDHFETIKKVISSLQSMGYKAFVVISKCDEAIPIHELKDLRAAFHHQDMLNRFYSYQSLIEDDPEYHNSVVFPTFSFVNSMGSTVSTNDAHTKTHTSLFRRRKKNKQPKSVGKSNSSTISTPMITRNQGEIVEYCALRLIDNIMSSAKKMGRLKEGEHKNAYV